MGILSALERRASPENPSTNLSAWIDSLGGGRTKSGVSVDEVSALNLSAVWAAVRVLTDTVASTPIHVYERLARGKSREPSHPLYRLLHDRPNPQMSAYTLKEVLQGHLALRGNAYAEKERNGRGEVVALWPITPDRVTPRLVEVRGSVQKVFEVRVGGETKVLGPDKVMHLTGFGHDGLVGYSPIHFARESLGLAKAAEEFGGSFFGRGLRASGALTHPSQLSEQGRRNLRESVERMNTGLENAHRILLLEEGMTWAQTSLAPEDAQFLETRQFQTVEIARWFQVPPHKIGDLSRATFSNIEHQSIEFLTGTARPWFVRWEQTLNEELFSAADRNTYFAEFKMDALLRGDTAARGAFYAQLFNIGALSQNDIREKENENPIEGGDRYFVQGALVPVDKIDDVLAGNTPTAPAAPAPEPAARFHLVFLDAAERILRSEIPHLRHAAKAGAVRQWADEFYHGEHLSVVASKLLPACLALDPANGARMAGLLAAEWAYRSLTDVKQADDVGAVVDSWQNGRAEEWARSIIERGGAV